YSVFFFSSRRRHTRFSRDWSSDVCSSDLFELPRNSSLRQGADPLQSSSCAASGPRWCRCPGRRGLHGRDCTGPGRFSGGGGAPRYGLDRGPAFGTLAAGARTCHLPRRRHGGQRAASRVAERALPLLKPGCSLRFAMLPPDKDPDSLIQLGGVEAMARLVQASVPLELVVWRDLVGAHRLDSPERQAALRQAVLTTV